MTSNYVKGRYFEYEVERSLRKKGWVVFRSAGSRNVDLIAFRENARPLWISCKYGRGAAPTDLSWCMPAEKLHAIYLEARRIPGEEIKWKKLA
jgi:hypothetical protein